MKRARPGTRQLQRLIDRCVTASNSFHLAQAALNDYCAKRYGKEPGEVDADSIIDGVFGGCGLSDGMESAEFEAIMLELTKGIS